MTHQSKNILDFLREQSHHFDLRADAKEFVPAHKLNANAKPFVPSLNPNAKPFVSRSARQSKIFTFDVNKVYRSVSL